MSSKQEGAPYDSGNDSGAEDDEPELIPDRIDDEPGQSSKIDDERTRSNYQSSVAIPDDMIVHLETTQATRLRPDFEAMAPMLVDGRIDFLKTGMYSRNSDFKAATIIDLVIDKAEHYQCRREQTIWINFHRLVKVMRDLGEEDILCFQLTESSLRDNHLRVLHKAPKFSQLYRIILRLAPDPDKIPKFDLSDFTFRVRVDIEAILLQKLTRTHEKNADYVRFAAYHSSDGENVLYAVIASTGDEALGTSIIPCEIRQGESGFKIGEYVINAEGKDASRGSLQGLRRLSLCAKATASSKFATLFLGGPDEPMAIRYETGTIGHMTIFLAGVDDDVEQGECQTHTQAQDLLDEKEVRHWEKLAREKNLKQKQDQVPSSESKTTFKRRKEESSTKKAKVEQLDSDNDETGIPKKRKQQEQESSVKRRKAQGS